RETTGSRDAPEKLTSGLFIMGKFYFNYFFRTHIHLILRLALKLHVKIERTFCPQTVDNLCIKSRYLCITLCISLLISMDFVDNYLKILLSQLFVCGYLIFREL